MATAAGIIVVAGAITLANEGLNATYVQGATNVLGSINWRVIPATVVAALLFAGLEQINAPLAEGLAGVALVTTLIHPFGSGPSPLVHLSEAMGYSGKSTSGFNAPLPTAQGPISV